MLQLELDFSTEKINENFSNYSAFHHRSVYIKDIVNEEEFESILEGEFSIIESAVYTDPYDQSAWWYMQFLLVWASSIMKKVEVASSIIWFYDLLCRQQVLLQTLLEVEKNSKWTMNALILLVDVFLLDDCFFFRKLKTLSKQESLDPNEPSIENIKLKWKTEKRSLLEQLVELDSLHVSRYKYLMAKLDD